MMRVVTRNMIDRFFKLVKTIRSTNRKRFKWGGGGGGG
jgi:hypothetical protein